MDLLKQLPVYETSNADLATFLLFEGIRLLEFRVSPTNPKVIIIRFADECNKCLDLERVFLNSDFKRYRDLNKWLLNKIHSHKKQVFR